MGPSRARLARSSATRCSQAPVCGTTLTRRASLSGLCGTQQGREEAEEGLRSGPLKHHADRPLEHRADQACLGVGALQCMCMDRGMECCIAAGKVRQARMRLELPLSPSVEPV